MTVCSYCQCSSNWLRLLLWHDEALWGGRSWFLKNWSLSLTSSLVCSRLRICPGYLLLLLSGPVCHHMFLPETLSSSCWLWMMEQRGALSWCRNWLTGLRMSRTCSTLHNVCPTTENWLATQRKITRNWLMSDLFCVLCSFLLNPYLFSSQLIQIFKPFHS